jgi:hypothetical protein
MRSIIVTKFSNELKRLLGTTQGKVVAENPHDDLVLAVALAACTGSITSRLWTTRRRRCRSGDEVLGRR